RLPLGLRLMGALPVWFLAAVNWLEEHVASSFSFGFTRQDKQAEEAAQPLKRSTLLFLLQQRQLHNAKYTLHLIAPDSGLSEPSLGFVTLNGHPLGDYVVSAALVEGGAREARMPIPPDFLIEGLNVINIVDMLGARLKDVFIREVP
ncbi:hypothetical protein EAH_00042310, partial [Eimeria acervulina]